MQTRKVLANAVATLEASAAIDHWQQGRERIEAEDLLAHVMGEEPDLRDEIPASRRREFDTLIARRAKGEPIPYIKGTTEFLGLELLSRPGVFVPRDSSEFLATQAIRRLRGRRLPVHMDLATGAGTIALAVADAVPSADVYGADLSKDAVTLARRNAKRLGLRATFAAGDLFDPFPKRLRGTVDTITLHPPYVALDELDELPDEIRAWEPEHTLSDLSHDGLGLVGRTVDEAPRWLRGNGWLLIEVSPDRARSVSKVLRRGGFRDVQSTKGGELKVTRVVVGRRPR